MVKIFVLVWFNSVCVCVGVIKIMSIKKRIKNNVKLIINGLNDVCFFINWDKNKFFF